MKGKGRGRRVSVINFDLLRFKAIGSLVVQDQLRELK